MGQPLPKDVDFLLVNVWHDAKADEDWFDGDCIEKGYVQGFNAGESAEGHDQCGELVVKATDGIAHTFKIHVTHQFLIPEDMYTLLGEDLHWFSQWAVGRRLPDQRFEKVSAVVIDFKEMLKLRNLGLVARSCKVLV